VSKAQCTCPIGLGEACGHITGVLYQLAKYKMLGTASIPEDVAKTSQPQTWHQPRGQKIGPQDVHDLELRGYNATTEGQAPKCIKSTLYNPIRTELPALSVLADKLIKVDPKILAIPALQLQSTPLENTKFGLFPRGSAISYQQKLATDCSIDIYDGVSFPLLPVENVMINNMTVVLDCNKSTKFKELFLSRHEIHAFEEKTRLQSNAPLWHKLRLHRITASKIGSIYSRRENFGVLATQLCKQGVTTAAMKQGLLSEPIAADAYKGILNNAINIYPCGVIISPWAPWLAASPDRKIYDPARQPAFGLLEIKCPQGGSILNVPYLQKDPNTGNLQLKRNHAYYFQIQTQLAVAGLSWCDFFVWTPNDHHVETCIFDPVCWQSIKDKVDCFFFNYFL